VSHLSRGISAPYPVSPAAHPGYIAGLTYQLPTSLSNAGAPAAVDTVYLWLWMPGAAGIAKSFGVRVAALGAGSAVKVGLWANNPATMRPTSTPVRSNNTGAATTGASTTVLLTVSDWAITPGVPMWLGAKFTGTLPTVMLVNTGLGEGVRLFGGALIANTAAGAGAGLSAPDAYANDIGALSLTSASFTQVAGATGIPAFYMGT
jgi:hypothetical protein